MRENCIHVTFVVDESGSMYPSVNDVTGGFNRVIEEQKAVEDGTCLVSYFKFADEVTEVYKMKDVKEVEPLTTKNYSPGGCTAMNDGIGTAIDKVGKWLSDMDESERPEKNVVVIITDGEENASKEYSFDSVKEKIKHQEEKYSWSFIYLGTDISDANYANSLGINLRAANTRGDMGDTYAYVSSLNTAYRKTSGTASDKFMAFAKTASEGIKDLNLEYEIKTGIKINEDDDTTVTA